MKTHATKRTEIQRRWYLVDADGVVLGRLASKVAQLLRGKHKPYFAPYLDCGDHVVVVNAAKVRLTGHKPEQKRYFRHSGYMGHEKLIPFKRMLAKHPERVVELAVKGMLPKNELSRKVRKKLKVYAGPEHPHVSQRPEKVEV